MPANFVYLAQALLVFIIIRLKRGILEYLGCLAPEFDAKHQDLYTGKPN